MTTSPITTSARSACLLVIAVLLLAPPPSLACEAGVCDGTVTDDGRPLCWKLRVQIDIPNDLHYFAAGEEHHAGLGPALYSYLGTGPADDGDEGPVRGGVNGAGLAMGFNAYHGGDWEELHHYAFGFAATTAEVSTHVHGMTTLGTIHYATDAQGNASLWENDVDPSGHWEYTTQAPARAEVWRDFDGDPDEISYAGWIGRANIIDMHTDGMDSLRYGEDDRTAAAQTVPGRLVDSGALTVENLAVDYFRHDVLARDATVSSMIVHGVLPGEDVRLTTMWLALGHSEAGIFVPVWMHGVEAAGGQVPDHLDHSDSNGVYVPAKGLINDGADEGAVQARTLPVESHYFAVVRQELLPAWRLADWSDPDVVAVVGEQMRRVQEQLDRDAYSLINGLYLDGVDNHAPLASHIDGWSAEGLTVTFEVTAADGDGSVASTLWNYGDGQTGSAANHTYDDAGTYLVSFTATDDDGTSHTDWEFVTVVDPTTAVAAASEAIALDPCYPNPCNPRTMIAFDLPRAAAVRLSLVDLAGRRVRTLNGGGVEAAGRHETFWDGRDDAGQAAPAGVYLCLLEVEGARAMRRVVLLK